MKEIIPDNLVDCFIEVLEYHGFKSLDVPWFQFFRLIFCGSPSVNQFHCTGNYILACKSKKVRTMREMIF